MSAGPASAEAAQPPSIYPGPAHFPGGKAARHGMVGGPGDGMPHTAPLHPGIRGVVPVGAWSVVWSVVWSVAWSVVWSMVWFMRGRGP